MTTVQDQIVALERKVGPQASSPLFAQLAALYLESGRARDALRVCDSGLAHHPYFSTGHLLKGKALSAMNMRAEARREFEYVLELLPGQPAIAELLRSIPIEAEEPPARVVDERVAPPAPEAEIQREPEPEPEPEPQPEPEPPVATFERARYQEESVEPEAPPVFTQPEATAPEEFGARPSEEVAPEPVPEFTPEPSPYSPSSEDAFGVPAEFAPEPVVEAPAPHEEATVEPPAIQEAVEEPAVAVPEEDLVGFGPAAETPSETVADTPIAAEAPTPSPSGEFDVPPEPSSFLEGIALQTPEPVVESAAPASGPDYGFSGSDLLFSGPADEDTFEKYSFRMRAEISGEGTMTLEDFLNNVEPAPAVAPAGSEPTIVQSKDRIEELAEKLQTARKITPVINITQKTSAAVSEQDTPASTGFVTPTLAEIYAKQGWYDDAIKAYRTLSVTKPAERERFERRIKELEDLKRRNVGL